MAVGSEEVQYRILMDAVKALEDLQKLKTEASTVDDVFDQVAVSIVQFAQKANMSIGAVKALFKEVIALGEQMRQKMELGPLPVDQQRMAGVDSPFLSDMSATGFKEVDARIQQILAHLQETQARLEQVDAQAKNLGIDFSKAAQSAALLAVYTKQGFQNLKFGNQNETVASIEALKNSLKAIQTETGQTFEQIAAQIKANFQNVPKFAVNDALKQLNAELRQIPTNAQAAGQALANALKTPSLQTSFKSLDFTKDYQGSFEQLKTLMTDLHNTTGATFEQIKTSLGKTFTNIPVSALTNSVKELNAQLYATSTAAQAAGVALQKALNTAPFQTKLTSLDFTKNYDVAFTQLKSLMSELQKATGATFEQVGKSLRDSFTNIPVGAVSQAVKELNTSLYGTATAAQKAGDALAQALKAPDVTKLLSGLKFPINDIHVAKQSYQSLMETIQKVSAQTGLSFDRVGAAIKKTFTNIPTGEVNRATKELQNNLDGVKSASDRAVTGINAVRIALGAMVAMLVFQVTQAISNFFKSVVQGAADLEMALYRLEKVERSLSRAGVDITPKGLEEGIRELKSQFDFLSEVDISQLLGNVALLTKELKLSERQIIDLSRAIINLNINSQENEDILSTSSKVITAMITGQARGVSTLGVSFSEAAMQARGLQMGILSAEQSLSDLTDQQKAQIKLGIIFDTAGLNDAQQMLKDTISYQDTLEGKTNTLKGAWEEFTALLGEFVGPVLKEVLSYATESLKGWITFFQAIRPLILQFVSYWTAGIHLIREQYDRLWEKKPPLIGKDALDEFKRLQLRDFSEMMGGLGDAADTATGPVNELANAVGNLDEALNKANFDDLQRDLDNLYDKARDMERDFQEKMQDMEEDYLRDRQRAREDYERDVADAIQDYNDQRADAEARYRLQELEAEARYQERLRQLREKFLYSLEDALRERDARQVLRLIREYNMEKKAAENEEKIRKESAARQHAEEMARLKREMEERLQKLAEEFQIKQQRAKQDYLTKKERELREHEEDMAELQEQIQERLDLFAAKLAEELGLRGQAADDLRNLLNQYYGPGGAYDQLYDYSAASLQAKTAALLAALQQMYAQAQAIIPTFTGDDWWNDLNTGGGNDFTGDDWWNDINHARGGSFMATTPTLMRVGEAGREFVDIVPTKDMGNGGGGGSAQVLITLSEGLEGQIIDKSLEGMSVVLEQVRRNR